MPAGGLSAYTALTLEMQSRWQQLCSVSLEARMNSYHGRAGRVENLGSRTNVARDERHKRDGKRRSNCQRDSAGRKQHASGKGVVV
jgi:hypothetical protein